MVRFEESNVPNLTISQIDLGRFGTWSEPLDIVRILTALYIRVEQGEWTGILEKEVENFANVLKKVLEQVPSDDVERKKKLQNFGTGKKLAKRLLIRDVNQFKSKSSGYEKTMWERIGTELEKVNVESLGFDHPIYSRVLDIKSEPFTEMPGSLCDVFKEPFEKYKLNYNGTIMDTCKEFIHNKESKINLDEDLHDVELGKWLDSPEKLQEMTGRILES
ncbi:2231_t:CDS:2, partial [Funneliformis geosporum]